MGVSALLAGFKKNKNISEFLSLKTLTQFFKSIISGLLSGTSEILLLVFLTEYVEIWYLLSNCASYIIAFWLNFLLNKYWTFKSKGNFGGQLVLFTMLFGFNLMASTGIIYLLTEILGLYYMISKLLSVGMIAIWNFVIYKKVIYKKKV